MTFTAGSKRGLALQGFFHVERSREGQAGAASGGAGQAKGRSFWAGKAPRPDLLPAGMRGPAVQAKGALGSAWPGAPRPELLPGMGRPKLGMLRGVAQRRGEAGAGVVTSPVSDGRLRLIGAGKPLESGIRERMEGLFGADFSGVRVHEGPAASAMGALAFTLGETLHFAPGLYDPTTREGVALLGHELTHVVQQRDGRVSNPYGRGVAIVQDPGLEAEAEAMGRRVAEEMWARGKGGRGDSVGRGRSKMFGGLRLAEKRGLKSPSMPRGTVQRSPLMLTDRPWEEMEDLISTFGREAVSSGRLNHIPTREQVMRGLVSPVERPLLSVGPPRVVVAKYEGRWDEDQPIVQDALAIYQAWEEQAKRARGPIFFKKRSPGYGKCSGANWDQIDEGMDVAENIADVDSNGSSEDRNAEDVLLFKAYYEGEEDAVIGILILEAHRKINEIPVQLGIRWMVGHPGGKGAGLALMAVANRVHETAQYNQETMHVTSAASAAWWYEKQGFKKTGRSECNVPNVPCGCWEMEKDPP